MAGTIVVDRIESDASYASTINVAGQITFSNTVNFGAYSGTAPVSGFYLPSTNNLAFTTASTERLRIDNAGNIGIGTSGSPSTTNGAVTLNVGLKTANNMVLSMETANLQYGGSLEFRRTSRAGSARFAQITGAEDASANGLLYFYTASASADVTAKALIDGPGRFTLTSQPFFYAYLSSQQTGYNATSQGDVVVIYGGTNTNTGSHYNTSTGKFTAPVAGNYIFHASAYSTGTTFVQMWLVVNGSRAQGTDWVQTASGFATGFWLIKLAANDTVGFHPYNASVTSATISTATEHNYFKGYLLG